MNFDFNLLGRKIQALREGLLIPIDEVSLLLGIPLNEYIRIESGENAEISGDLIIKLSQIFEVDFRYFVSGSYKTADDEVLELYRKNATLSKNDRLSIQKFIKLCEHKNDLESLLNLKKPNIPDYSTYNFKSRNHIIQGKECADIERKRLNILGPVTNVFSLLRTHNIHIFRKQLDEKNISGIYIKHPIIGHCILINYIDDVYRQNFSFTHEYCHAIFDSNTKQNVSYFHENDENYIEYRANSFASYFLLPPNQMEVFNQNLSEEKFIELIIRVCNHYRINRHVVIYRLATMKLIPQEMCKSLLTNTKIKKEIEKVDSELEKCSINNRTCFTSLIKSGLSIEYIELCRNAFDQGEISFNKLKEILMINHEDSYDLLRTWNITYGGK